MTFTFPGGFSTYLPYYVSASSGLSRVLDEPVNPRKREGESSPVNAEVMTGVVTLKDPRRSAIAGTVVLLLPLSLSLSFSLASTFSYTLLGNPSLTLTVGLDNRHVPHSAVNLGQRAALA